MAKIGFARVSTQQQDLTEQSRLLKEYGCTKIFAGKHSGKADQNKEQIDELLNYVREGDVVVVTKLDRLGRSLTQCLKTLDFFKENNIGFIALDQGIDTTKRKDPMAMAMIHLLGLFAELERSFIVERTQEGKRAKLAAGQKNALGGRPPKVTDKLRREIYKDFEKGVSINIATQKYNLSRATIARLKGNFNRSKIST